MSTTGDRTPTARFTARMLHQTMLITAATAVTATFYGGFFAGWGFLPRLIAVAVAAAALAWVFAAVRIRTLPGALACVAAFAVTSLLVVLPGTGAVHGGASGVLRVGWRALIGGWASMLSIAAPASDSPQLLMAPALVTWLAGFLAVTLALRTRSVLGPSAILVCALAMALMFASTKTATHLIQTSAFLVLLIVLTLTRAAAPASQRPYSVLRAAGSNTVFIAAVAGVGLVAALVTEPLGAAQRFNPRVLLTTPLHLEQAPDPLSEIREQQRLPAPRDLFTVTFTGGVAPSLVQTVALADFDGSQWTSADTFRVAGPVLAPGPAVTHAVTLSEHVTLRMLTGPYLPVAGRATRIDASLGSSALIGFDPDSGALVAADAGFAGGSYTVVAEGSAAGSEATSAAVGGGAAFAAYTRLPAVPAPLAALAARITARARTPYTVLTALDDYLKSLPINVDAPAGDSYGALSRLLTATTPQGQAGYADQHAAAFAMLARIEHIPTRVVVGYRLPAPDARTGASRTYTVTTADSYAWAQAYFQGYGWIDFDPTNTSDTITVLSNAPVPPKRPSAQPFATESANAAPGPTQSAPQPASPEPTPVAGAGPGPRVGPIPVGWAVAVLALLVPGTAVAGATAVRRLIRRARRRGGEPAVKVVGAWQEAVDRLADAGVAIDTSLTALEFAARAGQKARARPTREQRALALTAPLLARLAARATDAAFSGEPPSEADVNAAWTLERDIGTALSRGTRIPYRLAHWTVPLPRRRMTGG